VKRISTPYTFSRKFFPFLFYGFLAMFLAFVGMSGAFRKEPLFLVVPCVMAVGGYFFMRAVLRDLVDDVYDCGSFLLVRKGRLEESIPLANIINVNFAINQRPARITLTLDKPGKFGKEISFAPPPKIYLIPYPRNEVVEDLIERAQMARSRPAR